MSLLDLLLVLIVGGSIVAGFMAGFARAGLGFAASIAGMLFGFWFYSVPAAWFRGFIHSPAVTNILGFFVVFYGVALVGALAGKLLSKLFKWTGLSWLDRVLGAGFGLVRGMVAAVAFVAVLLAFTPRPLPNWMIGSALLPYAVDASDICAALAPRPLREAFRESVNSIRKAWDDQLKKAKPRDSKSPPKEVQQ